MRKNFVIPISEKFNSIQGEGRFAGRPVRFIRVSKCTRTCKFCDTSYHVTGKKESVESIAKDAAAQNLRTIVVTGGEPLLYWQELVYLSILLNRERHFVLQLETNGDLLVNKKVSYSELFSIFDYVSISPKSYETAKKLHKDLVGPLSKGMCDIKVVTNMKDVGDKMIKYATMLMPLTTYNDKKDVEIRKAVWDYCIESGLRYSPRLHVDMFGKKRGV